MSITLDILKGYGIFNNITISPLTKYEYKFNFKEIIKEPPKKIIPTPPDHLGWLYTCNYLHRIDYKTNSIRYYTYGGKCKSKGEQFKRRIKKIKELLNKTIDIKKLMERSEDKDNIMFWICYYGDKRALQYIIDNKLIDLYNTEDCDKAMNFNKSTHSLTDRYYKNKTYIAKLSQPLLGVALSQKHYDILGILINHLEFKECDYIKLINNWNYNTYYDDEDSSKKKVAMRNFIRLLNYNIPENEIDFDSLKITNSPVPVSHVISAILNKRGDISREPEYIEKLIKDNDIQSLELVPISVVIAKNDHKLISKLAELRVKITNMEKILLRAMHNKPTLANIIISTYYNYSCDVECGEGDNKKNILFHIIDNGSAAVFRKYLKQLQSAGNLNLKCGKYNLLEYSFKVLYKYRAHRVSKVQSYNYSIMSRMFSIFNVLAKTQNFNLRKKYRSGYSILSLIIDKKINELYESLYPYSMTKYKGKAIIFHVLDDEPYNFIYKNRGNKWDFEYEVSKDKKINMLEYFLRYSSWNSFYWDDVLSVLVRKRKSDLNKVSVVDGIPIIELLIRQLSKYSSKHYIFDKLTKGFSKEMYQYFKDVNISKFWELIRLFKNGDRVKDIIKELNNIEEDRMKKGDFKITDFNKKNSEDTPNLMELIQNDNIEYLVPLLQLDKNKELKVNNIDINGENIIFALVRWMVNYENFHEETLNRILTVIVESEKRNLNFSHKNYNGDTVADVIMTYKNQMRLIIKNNYYKKTPIKDIVKRLMPRLSEDELKNIF